MSFNAIVIWGIGGQGKSETIRHITKLILVQYPSAKLSNPIKSRGDVKVIITVGKCTIGIEGQGDPGNRQGESLDEFVADGCNIIICSCRSFGETYDKAVYYLSRKGYEVVQITNMRSESKDKNYLSGLNKLSAELLLPYIQTLIDKKK